MLHQLYLWSWNPLVDGVIGGGLFALLGAYIGGRLVIGAERQQRNEEMTAAVRSIAAELATNLTKLDAVRFGIREHGVTPLHWEKFNYFPHQAVDSQLARAALRLSSNQFVHVLSAYSMLAGADILLERIVRKSASTVVQGAEIKELLTTLDQVAQSTRSAVLPLLELTGWDEAERSQVLKELELIGDQPRVG